MKRQICKCGNKRFTVQSTGVVLERLQYNNTIVWLISEGNHNVS